MRMRHNGSKPVLKRMVCLSLIMLIVASASVQEASATNPFDNAVMPSSITVSFFSSSRLPVKLSSKGQNNDETNEVDLVEKENAESAPETKALANSIIIPEEEPDTDAEEKAGSVENEANADETATTSSKQKESSEVKQTQSAVAKESVEEADEQTTVAETESQNAAKKWFTFATTFNGENTGEGVTSGGAYYGDAEKLLSAMDRNPIYNKETRIISFRMMNGVRAVVGRESVKIEYVSDIYTRETNPKKQGLRVIDPSLGAPLLIVEGTPMINLEMLAGMLNLDGTWYDNAKLFSLKTEGFRTEQQTEMPYKIRIEKSKFRMYIYAADEFGEYSILTRECKVAVGRTSVLTPVGTHKITRKEEWHAFNNGWYAKYCSQYASGLYIHSELYRHKDLSKMSQNSYNQIGTKATSGCIRTYLKDARWVYENCPIGTEIEIVN